METLDVARGDGAPCDIRALYVHVPFCASKCYYCDFDSRACRDRAAFEAYVRAVEAQIEAASGAHALDCCQTAYIGGGTPSVLGGLLAGLVAAVRRGAPHVVEFTCEANPESFSSGLAESMCDAGATRVSFGVQSFDDAELRALGRLHSAEAARNAVRIAHEAGLEVSIDLMCGIPLQTEASWSRSLDEAAALGVRHVSVYPLTIEEGTAFSRKVAAGAIDLPDEDFEGWCMQRARERLVAEGLLPYEVASYAADGHACRHNIAYWTGVGYLGLGRSAAGMMTGADYLRLRSLFGRVVTADGDELAGGCVSARDRVRLVQRDDEGRLFEAEVLTEREAVAEDLMLGMRMTAGVGCGLVDRAGAVLGRGRVEGAVELACRRGLATWAEGRLVPTRRGWLLGNELFELFWDLAEE